MNTKRYDAPSYDPGCNGGRNKGTPYGGRQISFGDVGASYSKRLVFKKSGDCALIEMHPARESGQIAIDRNVLAKDYAKAFSQHIKILARYQRDEIGAGILEGLKKAEQDLKQAVLDRQRG
ncbi:hypothetical protein [Bacillus sp. FJAT-42376]|uniref:hypothetical protein n=1 Tax=Bacillus sp. FJAT-42376 TaxID=2014076 RepID=UPI000F511F27|nr:hypothetical protein [Bacillus sp. FJAT-42376]